MSFKAPKNFINCYTEGLPKNAYPGSGKRIIMEPVDFETSSGGIFMPTDTNSLLFHILAVGHEVTHPMATPGNFCVPLLPALSTVDTKANFHSVLEEDVLAYYTPEQLTRPESLDDELEQMASDILVRSGTLTAGEARRLGMKVPLDLKPSDPFTPQEDK